MPRLEALDAECADATLARLCSAALPITPSPITTVSMRAMCALSPREGRAIPQFCRKALPLVTAPTAVILQPMRLIFFSLAFSLVCGPGSLASAAAPTRDIPLPRPRPPEAEQAQPSEPPIPAGPSQCFVDLTSSGVAIAESLPPLEARRGCGAESTPPQRRGARGRPPG